MLFILLGAFVGTMYGVVDWYREFKKFSPAMLLPGCAGASLGLGIWLIVEILV